VPGLYRIPAFSLLPSVRVGGSGRTSPEQFRCEDGVGYVEIELGLEKTKLGILRESLRKQ
jgi:hypothetical protein